MHRKLIFEKTPQFVEMGKLQKGTDILNIGKALIYYSNSS